MKLLEYLRLGLRHRRDPFYAKYLSGRRVLDIGCGHGEFLARDAANTVGVDLDANLVNECRARGLEAHCMSALSLDFQDATFEAVHAAQLIEHFAPVDAMRFLAEAARVLKPGGYLFLTTPGIHNVWGSFSHIRPYPPTAFQKLLIKPTENYLREGQPQLEFVDAQGYRFFFERRAVMFASSLIDLLSPPGDPIGWTIILRRK